MERKKNSGTNKAATWADRVKTPGKSASSEKVFTSQCFIGGEIKKCGATDETGWVLVDTGDHSKFIFCELREDQKLLDRLCRYNEGDHILIHGYVRTYSVKKDDKWENKTTIRITDIRSEDPAGDSGREAAAEHYTASDDDIPF